MSSLFFNPLYMLHLSAVGPQAVKLKKSVFVSMRIRIRLFSSMQIRIRIQNQGAKSMQIHADPDPGQTLLSQKDLVYPLILINLLAPRSGSAFPIRIPIRIQESQINADPDPVNGHELLKLF
jgi:hypothetical protein